jgi:hypothetical protein
MSEQMPTLKVQGHLDAWEAEHPFDREALIDPLLAFRITNRRRHHDIDDASIALRLKDV